MRSERIAGYGRFNLSPKRLFVMETEANNDGARELQWIAGSVA
jgi:hypothetical protein